VDRRSGIYGNTYHTGFNDDYDLYGNRYIRNMQQDSGSDGNGNAIAKRNSELTKYLLRRNSNLNSN